MPIIGRALWEQLGLYKFSEAATCYSSPSGRAWSSSESDPVTTSLTLLTPPTMELTLDPASVSETELLDVYADVFDNKSQPLMTLPSEPTPIEVAEDAEPYCVAGPRPIPFNLQDKVKADLIPWSYEGLSQKLQSLYLGAAICFMCAKRMEMSGLWVTWYS